MAKSTLFVTVTECTYYTDWGFWTEEKELFVFKKNDGKTISHETTIENSGLEWEVD